MSTQNQNNHARYVPAFHFLTLGLIIIVIVLAAFGLVHALGSGEWLYAGVMPLMVSIILLLLFWFVRSFATTVQDRAIRAEENLRYFALTGKLFDPRLTMSQIIALRFAPDEELIELATRAATENMRPHDIKKAIKNWRPDHHRV